MAPNDKTAPLDFIREIITNDVAAGKHGGRVGTRFPPEPNGFLHIGHAKAFCLNFGVAEEFGGKCNLRFDDTNPVKEDTRFAEAIQADIKWMGYDWEDRLFYASDYFEQLYEFAVRLVKDGKAFVCDLDADEIRKYRGTLTEPGKNSPYRERSIEENLDLFERMRAGEFADGSRTLRAKIDMTAGNLNMRDPVIYRILRATHHRTGDTWCIYPMYDFTHCLSDSIEGITHSLCDLDFEDHRPLYDWFLDQLDVHHPQQIEFARLDISYMITSKRKLKKLINSGHVSGWDDPRMPTLRGLRRRGYSAKAIRDFIDQVGVAKRRGSVADIALLEHCLREDLNFRAQRVMAVLDPLKVIIDSYPEGQTEELEAVNNPENEADGTRMIPFSREIFIERQDFMEDPPKKFFRLAPGREVRLKHAYYITCERVVKNEAGDIIELHCKHDPESRGGGTPDGRRVKGTLHWVSAPDAICADIRLYDHLFTVENPAAHDGDIEEILNSDSLKVLSDCMIEPSLADAKPEDVFQFMRQGYFCLDSKDATADRLVFNRTVGLRDSWAKIAKARKK